MGSAYFYHLTESALEAALPMLAERALGAGWRVVVWGPDAVLDHLDGTLWQGPAQAFLPHGWAGGAHDAAQPVLLGGDAVNGAQCLMAVAGAEVTAQDVARFERVCVVFDGQDGAAVARARVQWKALTDAGVAALYWAQQDGSWVKKAESGAG